MSRAIFKLAYNGSLLCDVAVFKAQMLNTPPKLNSSNNVQNMQLLVESGIRFAISEFDNDFILGLANDYKLNIITIGERQNMKNRRTEILVTNYKKPLSLFDGLQ